ncbi:Hypothetical predicted protein [Xyrichtys novacula]|uniref:Uncharacterized protein n=1 Tax=Xyrichtys novacula TaxID=13765 RepID=A0AAV1G2Q7_XYRNO|nr:Hypothetical predicted protein [Xyrichtys novacula]
MKTRIVFLLFALLAGLNAMPIDSPVVEDEEDAESSEDTALQEILDDLVKSSDNPSNPDEPSALDEGAQDDPTAMDEESQDDLPLFDEDSNDGESSEDDSSKPEEDSLNSTIHEVAPEDISPSQDEDSTEDETSSPGDGSSDEDSSSQGDNLKEEDLGEDSPSDGPLTGGDNE